MTVGGFGSEIFTTLDYSKGSESSLLISAIYTSINGTGNAGVVFVYTPTIVRVPFPVLSPSDGCTLLPGYRNVSINYFPSQILSLPSPAPNDLFGLEVAGDEFVVAVASQHGAVGGMVHLFQHSLDLIWSLKLSFSAPKTSLSAQFGAAMSCALLNVTLVGELSQRTYMVIISDPGFAVGQGAVYSYVFQTLIEPVARSGLLAPPPPPTLVQTIRMPTPTPESYFGTSIATSMGFMAVGAPYAQDGIVYLYTQVIPKDPTSWTLYDSLYITDIPTAPSARLFGTSVALDVPAGILAVGAPGEASARGQVYVYDVTTNAAGDVLFTLDEAMLVSTQPDVDAMNSSARFGIVVSTASGLLAGSAIQANKLVGEVLLLTFNPLHSSRWNVSLLSPSAEALELNISGTESFYGGAVMVSPSSLVIGAPFFDGPGAVFVYNATAFSPLLQSGGCVTVDIDPHRSIVTPVVSGIAAFTALVILVAFVVFARATGLFKRGSSVPEAIADPGFEDPEDPPGVVQHVDGAVQAAARFQDAVSRRNRVMSALRDVVKRRKRAKTLGQDPAAPIRRMVWPEVPTHIPSPQQQDPLLPPSASSYSPVPLSCPSIEDPSPAPGAVTITRSNAFLDVTVTLDGSDDYVELRIHSSCTIVDVKRIVQQELSPNVVLSSLFLSSDGLCAIPDELVIRNLRLRPDQNLRLCRGHGSGVRASLGPRVRILSMDGRECQLPILASNPVSALKRSAIAQLCPDADSETSMLLLDGAALDDDAQITDDLTGYDMVLICPLSG